MSKKQKVQAAPIQRNKSTGKFSYKVVGSGVAVVSSANFVRSPKIQSGIKKFRVLSTKAKD